MKNSLSKQELINYSSHSKEQQLEIYDSSKLKAIEKIVFDKWLPKHRVKILDLGCGAGRTTVNLANLGHQVIGVDLVPAMIELAKKRYQEIDFRVMNACKLDFADASFDLVVFSFNGLDYIYPTEKRWQAVKEIYRVLKPGGLYIMSSHNSIIWPTNKYLLFFWFVNLMTGRIFTPYRLDNKSFRQGISFIYYVARPAKQINNIKRFGFEFLDIFANPKRKYFKNIMSKTKNLFLITLLDAWPYFVFRKK